MDWLTFISSVIASIAWPIVALIVLSILRGHLPAIGQMVRKVKYKDVEVEFGAAVQAVVLKTEASFPLLELTQVQRSEATQTREPSSSELSAEQLYDLAKVSDRAAIIEAWDRVEVTARKVLRVIPRPWNYPWTLKLASEELLEQSVLTKRQAEVFREMELLKHAVERHEAGNIDEESVKKYIQSALVLAQYLSAFLKQHPGEKF